MEPIEIVSLLRGIRDPAVFLFCVAIVFYLNRNYVSKENFESLKQELAIMKDRYEGIRQDYVSKEKLGDVLKPVEDQLKCIGREIGEIKQEIKQFNMQKES